MNHSRITPFIHEYEFPYHDLLLNNINYFSDLYDKEKSKSLENAKVNVPLPPSEISNFLITKLHDIVTQNYYVSPPFEPTRISVYKQDSKENYSISHNHIGQSIIGVFYLNPPKSGEGGEIKFHDRVYDDSSIILQPYPNRLYLFPAWMYHQPLPQTTNKPRLSFNWGYKSSIVPIHKISADRW